MTAATENPSAWSDELMAVIHEPASAKLRLPTLIDRVVVLAETASTQDAALRIAGGKPGLMVLAVRQTAGRGRLGRTWADTSHLGLAATFVLDAARYSAEHLSLAAGVAAACAIPLRGLDQQPACKLRWPNDVVEPERPHRKVAGVLIEIKDHLALVGIGINVLHRDADWPPDLKDRAVSIFQLCQSPMKREHVAAILVRALAHHLGRPADEIARDWSDRDILRNTRRSFLHNNQTYTGLVLSIDPTNHILLQLDDGTTTSLPALTTSLVHEA